jgi:hypothetical protein
MRTSTREAQARVLAAIEAGQSRQGAADAAGVSSRTFYRWLESERFRDAVAQAEGRDEGRLRERLERAGRRGSWRADLAMLERRHRRYGWRPELGVEVSGELEITPGMRRARELETLDDEELEEELARLRQSEARRANRGALPPLLGTSEVPE